MKSLIYDSYQEVSIDWLTVTPYDNHGGGRSNVAHPRIMGRGVTNRLIAYIEHKLDLTRQMKSQERNTNKEV